MFGVTSLVVIVACAVAVNAQVDPCNYVNFGSQSGQKIDYQIIDLPPGVKEWDVIIPPPSCGVVGVSAKVCDYDIKPDAKFVNFTLLKVFRKGQAQTSASVSVSAYCQLLNVVDKYGAPDLSVQPTQPSSGQLIQPWSGQYIQPSSEQLVQPWSGQYIPPSSGQLIQPWSGQYIPPSSGQLIQPWSGQYIQGSSGQSINPSLRQGFPWGDFIINSLTDEPAFRRSIKPSWGQSPKPSWSVQPSWPVSNNLKGGRWTDVFPPNSLSVQPVQPSWGQSSHSPIWQSIHPSWGQSPTSPTVQSVHSSWSQSTLSPVWQSNPPVWGQSTPSPIGQSTQTITVSPPNSVLGQSQSIWGPIRTSGVNWIQPQFVQDIPSGLVKSQSPSISVADPDYLGLWTNVTLGSV